MGTRRSSRVRGEQSYETTPLPSIVSVKLNHKPFLSCSENRDGAKKASEISEGSGDGVHEEEGGEVEMVELYAGPFKNMVGRREPFFLGGGVVYCRW